MTYAVAEVQNPFKTDPNSDRPPLSIGLFVEAEIAGRQMPNAIELPKNILYRGNEVLVLNDNDEVSFITLSLVQSDTDSVVTTSLKPGTRVVGTRIALPVPGMRVNTSSATASAESSPTKNSPTKSSASNSADLL
jgi:multidrug efflux pump subunit AcrA (membrane-fusion protein)